MTAQLMIEEAISVSVKARHDWAHAPFEDRLVAWAAHTRTDRQSQRRRVPARRRPFGGQVPL